MGTRTINSLRISVLLTSVLLTSQVMARDSHIAGCVDENGTITYTDTLCYTVNDVPSNEMLGLVAKDRATTKAPSIYDPFPLNEDKPEPILNARLQSATDMAISECTDRFRRFFKRKHPYASIKTDVTFANVVDQYENGNKISISLATELEYSQDSSIYKSRVECTVQNMQADTNWVVGFIEK